MADLPRFDLGQAGVVLTSTPVHGDPGQLTKGQNIEFLRDGGLGGVGSRGPLQPFSDTVMTMQDGVTPGSILAAIEVPLPSPVDNLATPTLFVLLSDGSFLLGGGFAPITPSGKLAPAPYGNPVALGGLVYYSTGDGAASINPKTKTTTKVYDATGKKVTSLLALNNLLYFCVQDNGIDCGNWNGSFTSAPGTQLLGRVIEYTPGSPGTTRVIGEEFGIASGKWDWLGQLSTGAANDVGSLTPVTLGTDGTLIYVRAVGIVHPTASGFGNGPFCYYGLHINPSPGANWSRDFVVFPTSGVAARVGDHIPPITPQPFSRPLQLAIQLSKFFRADVATLAQDTAAGSPQAVLANETDVVGFVATETPNPGAEWFSAPIEFGTSRFFAYGSADADPQFGAPTTASQGKIYVFTGTNPSTATLDLDALGTYGGNVLPGTPFVSTDGLTLYWPFYAPDGGATGYLLKRTVTGTWSQLLTGLKLSAFALSGDLVS